MHSEQDVKYFREIFNTDFPKIVSFLSYYCRDVEMAKNVAQDTFVTFWENLDKIDRKSTPLPYLYHISRNKLINVLHREVINGKYTQYAQRRQTELQLKAIESQSLEDVEMNELRQRILACLQQMNPNTAETFVLSRMKGMKNREIAEYLGVSIKTVEYRIMSALRILQKNLADVNSLILLAVGLGFGLL